MPIPRRRPVSGATVLRRIAATFLAAACIMGVIVLALDRDPTDTTAVAYRIVDNTIFPITLAQSKRDQQMIQRVGGGLGLWFVQIDSFLGSIWRPPRLAWTLMTLSASFGIAFLRLASLAEEGTADDD